MRTKVVFFGSTQLSAACLESLLNVEDFEIVLVVTQPDNLKSKKNPFNDVKKIALQHNLNLLQPQKITDIYDDLKRCQTNLGVCVAYGQFISTKICDLFSLGIINVHPSLLPKYRGGAPVAHAIWNNDAVTAISIMKIIQQMDAGPYCYQQEIKINPDWTAGDLMNHVISLAPSILLNCLRKIVANEITWIKQDETKKSLAPVLTREQERINWNQPANRIVQHIKAFSPQPGTFSEFAPQQSIKWFNAKLGSHHLSSSFGTINHINNEYICIQAQDDCVHITDFLLPGKKRIKVCDYHGTYPVKVNDRLM